MWFLCDDGDDTLAHALEPLTGGLDAAINAFHSYWPDPDRAVSATNALITLWLTSNKDSDENELVAAYETCLKIVIHGFAPYQTEVREIFRMLVMRQLAADRQRLPEAWFESVMLDHPRCRTRERG